MPADPAIAIEDSDDDRRSLSVRLVCWLKAQVIAALDAPLRPW